MELLDDRYDYGEPRSVAIGNVDDVGVLRVTWTPRGNLRRIISARRAVSRELEGYAIFRGIL
jgi:uncharacterized DUF497 family protein